eukprot:PITA_24953
MLMERARSRLSGARLGQELWVEVVETVCYLVNRSPSSVFQDKTPQEICTGYKLWNLETRKVVYSQDVVFREVKGVIKHEFLPKEPEKIDFEPKEGRIRLYSRRGIRRSVQEIRQPERYSSSSFCSNFSLSITNDDLRTMTKAVDSENDKLWKEAMIDEIASLHKNEAWDLVELSAGRKPIDKKWVFKKKMNAKGKVEKYKAWLVAKGYS